MTLNLKLILGILGNGTATALFLSPMPTFRTILRKKSTEEFSGLPYVCTIFNCALWVLYGLPFVKPHSVLILTINGFGLALEAAYILIFLTFATRDKKVPISRYLGIEAIAYMTIFLVTMLAMHSIALRQLVVGSICVVVTTAMYVSPLSVMGTVIRTRSVEYMPFLLSLFNFLNGFVWSAYSLVTRDIFIAIPNGLGALFGIAQLILYAIYKNAKPIHGEVDLEKKNIEQEPTTKLAMATELQCINTKPLKDATTTKNNTYVTMTDSKA